MSRGLTLVLLLLVPAFPAWAGDPVFDRFIELARGYDPADPEALPRVRAAITAQYPDFLETPMPIGPLRSDLAKALTRQEILRLFARATRDPRRQTMRWAALLGNLGSRADIAGILAEVGAPAVLIPVYDSDLATVAVDALLEGDPQLATSLLSDPRTAEDFADDLVQMNAPEGIRLVVDVVTGKIRIPAEARARLASVVPDVWNLEAICRLGGERVATLLRSAREDPDPEMRLLAARLLLVSGDPAAFSATVRAYAGLDSPSVDRTEWGLIASWWGLPPTDRDLPRLFRYEMLKGYLETEVYAETDFEIVEEMTVRLRGLLAGLEDLRLRGALIRILFRSDYMFWRRGYGRRKHPVPSWRALLEDLLRGREGDPPELTALGRRRAREALRNPEEEDAPNRYRGGAEMKLSPVVDLLSKAVLLQDEPGRIARLVRGWLEADPRHLLDPEVGERILDWPGSLRQSVLEAYPHSVLRLLLREPPSLYRDAKEKIRAGDDLTGAISRDRLLLLLEHAPRAARELLTPDPVLSWPARNRRSTGRTLHHAGCGPDDLGDLLGDDDFLLGFLERAMMMPRPKDLPLLVHVLTGEARRSELVGRLSDWAENAMPEILARDDESEWPEAAVILSAVQRAGLSRRLASASDPWVMWLAARLLAISGEVEDHAALLAHGNDLILATVRSGQPVADLVRSSDSLEKLDLLLHFLEREDVSADARYDVFTALCDQDWLEAFPGANRNAGWQRLKNWVIERVPGLRAHFPEAFLITWLMESTTGEEETVSSFLQALEQVKLEASRIRLRELLESVR